MKKLILMLLGVLMALPSIAVDFTYTYEGQTLNYTVISAEERTVETTAGTIYSGANKVSGNLIIPATVKNSKGIEYTVIKIADRSFYLNTGLTSVTIPESVTSIGEGVFERCSALTSVTIPESVTTIGENAFGRCPELISVTIPASVTTIGKSSFFECTGLTSVTIPESVTSIGTYAFSGCSALTSVTIPESVTSIGENTFSSCRALMSVSIPESVTSIGTSAFSGCSALTSVTIPESVTSIGDRVFSGCSGLTSVSIPETVTSIGSYAFYGCAGLMSVTIPASVTSIGSDAFYGCTGLTSVTIPGSVTSIGEKVFYGCTGLKSVTILESVKKIGTSTFSGCSALTSVTIPESVTSIGNSAFDGCSSLTSVTIPASVTSIGDKAFSGCTGLKSFILADGAVDLGLGTNVFENIDNLESVYLGRPIARSSSGTSGSNVFKNISISQLTIGSSFSAIEQGAFYGWKLLKKVKIPESVTSIGNRAFSGCSALTEITIPSKCKSVSEEAFYGCVNLSKVEFNGITRIFPKAFFGCSSLSEINLPEGLETIDSDAFYNTGLVSVVIPKSVKQIGLDAFAWCKSLTTVTILAQKLSVDKQAFRSDIQYVILDSKQIGDMTFYPEHLKKIIMREGTPLPKFYGNVTFNNITYYPDTEVDIVGGTVYSKDNTVIYGANSSGIYNVPVGVKRIGDEAFRYCSDLSSLYINGNIEYIGDNAFADCNPELLIKATTIPAPSFPESAFSGIYDTAVVNIPSYILGEYVYNGSPWNLFKNIKGVDYYSSNERFESDGLLFRYIDNSDTKAEVIADESYKSMTEISVPDIVTIVIQEATEDTPEITKEVSIVRISDFAFDGCEALESISLPESLTSISNGAFRNCTSLTSISIPSKVERINTITFEGCSNLSSLVCDGISEIGLRAFCGTSLAHIQLPSIKKIGNYAFDGVGALTSASFGEELSEIGDFAFRGNALQAVTLKSNNGLIIGNNAFSDNDALTQVTLGEGVVTVGDYAFANCKKLAKLTASKDLRTIGVGAFTCLNAGLTTLSIPKDGNLTEIGDNAFYGIRVRNELSLPDSLTRIGDDAFGAARLITKIVMPANKKLTVGKRAFATCQRLAEVEFPETITALGDSCFVDNVITSLHVQSDNIGKNAFVGSAKLTEVKVTGEGLIEENAFGELPELLTADLNTVTIGAKAFQKSPKLHTVTFRDMVKVIGKSSFTDSPNLEKLHFGLGLEQINDSSFLNTAVDSLSFPSAPVNDPKIVIGKHIFSSEYQSFNKKDYLRYLSLGNRVKSIDKYSYIHMSPSYKEVQCVDLGTSVESLGGLKIYSGWSNTVITLPASLDIIENCELSADSIVIPKSEKILNFSGGYVQGNTTFIDRNVTGEGFIRLKDEYCSIVFGDNNEANNDLSSSWIYTRSFTPGIPIPYTNNVHLGAAVKTVSSFKAKSVTFDEGIEEIESLDIIPTTADAGQSLRLPASLRKLGYINFKPKEVIFADSDIPLEVTGYGFKTDSLTSVFVGRDISETSAFTLASMPKLDNVIIGEKVTRINDGMFQNCLKLKSVVMGDNVKHIGANAFMNCDKLDILSIGESVETIGDNAYTGCTGFSKIVARGMTPPSGMAGFGMEVEDNVPLIVPEEALDDYMSSDLFFAFANFDSCENSNIVEEVETEGGIDEEFTVGSKFNLLDYIRFILRYYGDKVSGKEKAGMKKVLRAAATEPAYYWFSPNPDIASVDQNGDVTINREGETEIWAYVLDGSDKKAVISLAKRETPANDGDLNGDGVINAADLQVLVKHLVNPGASSLSDSNADINGDGVANAADLQHLISIIKQ